MIQRYRIKARKPSGKKVKIFNKLLGEIEKIRNAMLANNYNDIRVSIEPSPDELFVKGIMETQNCSPEVALEIYKRIATVMATKGIELTRKGDSVCQMK